MMTRRGASAAVIVMTLLAACGGDGRGPADLPRGPEPASQPSGPEGARPPSPGPTDQVRAEECGRWPETVREESERLRTTVGDLTFRTWAPIVVRLEDAVRLEVEVTNAGPADVEVELVGLDLDWAEPPPDPSRRWFTQLFELHPVVQIVPAGGTATYAWHLDPEDDLEERGEFPRLTYRFTTPDGPAELSATLFDRVTFGDPERLGLGLSGRVDGVVVDDAGAPLPDVEVVAGIYTFKEVVARARTDAQGRFAMCIPATEDYLERSGGRPPGYDATTHLIARTEDGGTYGFATVGVLRDDPMDVTIVARTAEPRELVLESETRLDTRHGWFWAAPLDGDVVAVEARHPPEIGGAGSVARVSADGTVVWRERLGDECWGFDVSIDGLIAVGCHDGTITVLGPDGTRLWSRGSQRGRALFNRVARFGPDGTTLLTGPLDDDAELLDARTGTTRWGFSYEPLAGNRRPEILRSAAFAPDGGRVVLGFAGGLLASLDAADGTARWQGGFIGEFPLLLTVDAAGDVFAAGKGREFTSYDRDGAERWRIPVYEAVTTATWTSLVDDLVVGHTVNGSVYALDVATGQMRWWRKVGDGSVVDDPVESSGHNALDVDPAAGLIAHVAVIDARRGRGGSMLTVLTTTGAVVATAHLPDRREEDGEEVEHVHRGGHGVVFLGGDRIAVAAGDGTIWIFRLDG